MKTLLVLEKAELLALMRGSSPAADKAFNEEMGDVIEGLSNGIREMVAEHEDELAQVRSEHETNTTALFEEVCEAAGFPAELPIFLLDFKLLIDLVETHAAEREWRENRGNVIVMKKRTFTKCQRCKEAPAVGEHTCPFNTEISNDHTLCNCCKKCERECGHEV